MIYETSSTRRSDWLCVVPSVLICLFASFAQAQVQPQAPPQEPPPLTPQPTPQPFTQEELKQLVGPVALYPDALIALILPASTAPSDLVLAARFVASKGDPAQVANQPWDESVKSLVRYPDIVKWMDQNLEWTTQLGEAFLDQPADVMNTIQQLRAQARAAGTLVDTPQQKVVEEKPYIRIVPAEREVIYVPQYDPEVVFAQSGELYPYGSYPYGSYEYGYGPGSYPYGSYGYGYGPYSPGPYGGAALTFGIGFAIGPWLNYDCDWPRRKVCFGDWNPGWRNHWDSDWGRGPKNWGGGHEVRNTVNVVNITSDSARVWEPSAKVQRQHWQRQRSFATNVSRENFRGGGENFRGRQGGGGDTWRRFSSVQKPSQLRLNGQEGDPGRQGWRRSNRDSSDFVRNGSDEFGRRGSRVRDVTPGPQFDQGGGQNSARDGRGRTSRDRGMVQDFAAGNRADEFGRRGSRVRDATPGPQFDQGMGQNSPRDGRGRASRGREGQQDLREPGNSRSRVQDVPPGPQFDQGGGQNSLRDDRGRDRRGPDVRETGTVRQEKSQSALREQFRRPSDVQDRNVRQDRGSVRTNHSSPSPNRNNFRSQGFKHSVSNAEGGSGGQIKSHRGSSSPEVRKSQSHTRVAKSQKGDGSRQAESSSSTPRGSQRTSSGHSNSRKFEQSARVQKSGGHPQRAAPSYSRQQGHQSAGPAGKSHGGGKQGGGKKAGKDGNKG
jgi:uncharacterized protein DUF3300